MKRSELVVGRDYLYSPHADWEQYPNSGHRVTLVTLDRLLTAKSRLYYREDVTYTTGEGVTVNVPKHIVPMSPNSQARATNVLVMQDRTLFLVLVSHLRAEWEAGVARQQEVAQKRAESAQRRQREKAVLEARFNAAMKKFDGSERVDLLIDRAHPDAARVTLPLEVFERLVGITS